VLFLLLLLLFVVEEFDESEVLFLSVVEYEPLLYPADAPSLLAEVLESELVVLSFEDVLELAFEPLLPLEKSPDLNPSALFELVELLLVLVEDLLDELLTEPELKPLLLDFELLELDLLAELDLLPLDLAKVIVLSDGLIPVRYRASNGKLENVKIKVRSIVKTYFFLIL